ncbi:hypothetical protein [Actinophytocola sp.]|jgi:transcriptional regulator with XRE-family HTH domain|uniref:hypothetical protein n=1 Tax=Actinophytocola sp. TaxID=1872138 RepID=UPI002ED85B27
MRERRRTLGLTQREVVGRLASQGSRTTNRALSSMENGRGLDLGLLPDLAESLECTVTYLLGLAEDPHCWQPDHDGRPPVRAVQPVLEEAGRAAGVLGPEIPTGFAAPGRIRRRGRPIAADGG